MPRIWKSEPPFLWLFLLGGCVSGLVRLSNLLGSGVTAQHRTVAMSARPEWDVFLLGTGGGGEAATAPRWPSWPQWSPAAATVALAAATLAAPALVWLLFTVLQRRADATLQSVHKFLASAKNRMLDMNYDPRFKRCLRALRRNEKEFAELLRACDRLPGQRPCRASCKQALACGSGDVVGGVLTSPSDSDCTLTPSDGGDESDVCCKPAATPAADVDPVRAARHRVVEEQGAWYAGAAHGMCLQNVEDSSEDDAAFAAEAAIAAREDQLWRQLYAEARRDAAERRRRGPKRRAAVAERL